MPDLSGLEEGLVEGRFEKKLKQEFFEEAVIKRRGELRCLPAALQTDV